MAYRRRKKEKEGGSVVLAQLSLGCSKSLYFINPGCFSIHHSSLVKYLSVHVENGKKHGPNQRSG